MDLFISSFLFLFFFLLHSAALLAQNNRLNKIDSIIAAFEELMSAHRQEVNITVTSATVHDARFIDSLHFDCAIVYAYEQTF